MSVDLFAGSISEFDVRIFDCLRKQEIESKSLISMIELVEHLKPDTLKNFPDILFNVYAPDYFAGWIGFCESPLRSLGLETVIKHQFFHEFSNLAFPQYFHLDPQLRF